MFTEGSVARRSVSRVLSRPRAGMAIHLGRSLPNASARPTRAAARQARPATPPGRDTGTPPAAPTWSCSRWGLPCRRRCRRRGALLPHRFTLAARPACRKRAGGVLSVALSLGSPPPGVTRHRTSVEPGLSSPHQKRRAAIRPSGMGLCGIARPRCQRPRVQAAACRTSAMKRRAASELSPRR